MLEFDKRIIGNRLLAYRKRAHMTQAEMAEAAQMAERAYADIERGHVNMRLESILKICTVLHITPNDLLTKEQDVLSMKQEELLGTLSTCTEHQRATALQLLEVYLRSCR